MATKHVALFICLFPALFPGDLRQLHTLVNSSSIVPLGRGRVLLSAQAGGLGRAVLAGEPPAPPCRPEKRTQSSYVEDLCTRTPLSPTLIS